MLELLDAQVYSSGTHDVYKQFRGCKHYSRPRSKNNEGALWLDLPRYHGQWQEDACVECDLSRLFSFVLLTAWYWHATPGGEDIPANSSGLLWRGQEAWIWRPILSQWRRLCALACSWQSWLACLQAPTAYDPFHHQVGQWMNNQKHGLGVLLDSNSQEHFFFLGGWMVDSDKKSKVMVISCLLFWHAGTSWALSARLLPPQSINFIATLNRIKPRSTGGMPFQQKCSKLCSTNTSGLKPERLYCRSSQLEAVGI